MKTVIKIFVVMFILNIASVVCPQKAVAQGPVNYQVFYDELSPYGEWVMYPNYGYVWIPNAGPSFSPYQSSGHWAFTNYGWTWVSDYQWGWAPFHYGRWDRDPYYGWIWIPGHQWAPAWVTWRHYNGFYGWAPIAPGIDMEYAYGHDYYPAQERWVFVNERYIDDPYVYRYYAPRRKYHRYIERGEVIHNRHDERERGYFFNEGPRREEVERTRHRSVERMEIRDHDRPGQNQERNILSIYRPEINRGGERNANEPAPRRVTEKNTIRPERDRPDVNKNRREEAKPIINKEDRNQPQKVQEAEKKGMDRNINAPLNNQQQPKGREEEKKGADRNDNVPVNNQQQQIQQPKVQEVEKKGMDRNINAPGNNQQQQVEQTKGREVGKKGIDNKVNTPFNKQQQINPTTPKAETPKVKEEVPNKGNFNKGNIPQEKNSPSKMERPSDKKSVPQQGKLEQGKEKKVDKKETKPQTTDSKDKGKPEEPKKKVEDDKPHR